MRIRQSGDCRRAIRNPASFITLCSTTRTFQTSSYTDAHPNPYPEADVHPNPYTCAHCYLYPHTDTHRHTDSHIHSHSYTHFDINRPFHFDARYARRDGRTDHTDAIGGRDARGVSQSCRTTARGCPAKRPGPTKWRHARCRLPVPPLCAILDTEKTRQRSAVTAEKARTISQGNVALPMRMSWKKSRQQEPLCLSPPPGPDRRTEP